jgi:membrane-bound serine protease (ClpP class)
LDTYPKRHLRRFLIMFLALMLFFQGVMPAFSTPEKVVYVIPIEGMIDKGLANFVERVYREADKQGVNWVILEIDTPGGLIEEAKRIRKIIDQSKTPTIAYVTGGAISAGALPALTSPELIMAPGATMGAAEPRLGESKAEEKVVSYWAGELAGAAEKNGRRADIARAMADTDIEIPGLVEKGKLLTLTAKQAQEYEMIDGILASRSEVLKTYGLEQAKLFELAPNFTEKVARWATNPYISSVLLTIGIAGFIIEIFTVGFGIAGIIGTIALALFFGGNILAGFSGIGVVLLFLLGLILLALEAFVIPGFGVAGIGGIVSIVGSIFLSAPSLEQAATSLVIAIVGTVVLVALGFKFLPTRKIFRRLVLETKQENTTGYVAGTPRLHKLEGKEGRTLTPLRPAGTAEIDNLRIDVITEGGFIDANAEVKVIKVEGSRVVVQTK